jgi:hypothetical protein
VLRGRGVTLGLTLRQIFEKLVNKNAINPKIDNPPLRFSPKSIDLFLPGFSTVYIIYM